MRIKNANIEKADKDHLVIRHNSAGYPVAYSIFIYI